MKCELCHKRDAAGVLHRKDANGEDEELYVCEDCLKGDTAADKPAPSDNASETANETDGDEPPAFIRNFLDAAVGLIEGVAGAEPPQEKKCRVCGATWKKIKSERLLGCPDCWSQFSKEIHEEFLTGAYGPRHVGKIPEKSPDGKPSRAFLEKELKEAVARQNYRKAARLRRQLDELDGKENGGGK